MTERIFELVDSADKSVVYAFGEAETSRSGRRVSVDFSDGENIDEPGTDLANVAALLFSIEGFLRAGKIPDLQPYTLRIWGVAPSNPSDSSEVLAAILQKCTGSSPRVEIAKTKNRGQFLAGPIGKSRSAILLFSGGTDSLSGLELCRRENTLAIPLFVAHGSGLTGLVNRLSKDRRLPELRALRTVRVQRRSELQQTRGLLYATLGAVVGRAFGVGRVIISECGPTMFLPPMCPLDEVTLTTNPVVLELARELVSNFLDWEVQILTPFADLTKAESLAWIKENPNLVETNSCVRPQFANYSVGHCGVCFGCLVRRVSSLVADCPESPQIYDPLFSRTATRNARRISPGTRVSDERMADILAVLEFCRLLLSNRLSPATNEALSAYGKRDLFERFALDFLTALYLGYSEEKIGRNDLVRAFFDECSSDGLISRDIAESRIEDVRSLHHVPTLEASVIPS